MFQHVKALKKNNLLVYNSGKYKSSVRFPPNWLANLPAAHCHLSLHLTLTGRSSDEVHKK